ncbi:hypothetical protein B0H67DRAFT_205180 [Lasiosphaeris hirsuta]|uniref:Uncharacterized protein n=1 Tax=Lasiosphaeris hirsuta TaxID=260670 RepID=A0AA40ARY3_9PEZI|nr:hypothetical protein B0H67DRAFT_205180 [Lasiosphaeris hirsuta]
MIVSIWSSGGWPQTGNHSEKATPTLAISCCHLAFITTANIRLDRSKMPCRVLYGSRLLKRTKPPPSGSAPPRAYGLPVGPSSAGVTKGGEIETSSMCNYLHPSNLPMRKSQSPMRTCLMDTGEINDGFILGGGIGNLGAAVHTTFSKSIWRVVCWVFAMLTLRVINHQLEQETHHAEIDAQLEPLTKPAWVAGDRRRAASSAPAAVTPYIASLLVQPPPNSEARITQVVLLAASSAPLRPPSPPKKVQFCDSTSKARERPMCAVVHM